MIGGAFERAIRNMIEDPAWFAIYAILLIVAIALHEWGHAVMAVACGDPTPKADGRVTLNPLAHLDPMGTIAMFFFGFGWGKPVMVQPGNFRNGRWDDVKVSAAGPAMNLFQALLFGIGMRTAYTFGVRDGEPLFDILKLGLGINIGLMVFNLIPVGPLDGATVIKGFLPLRTAYDFHQFNQRWGMLLMFLLVFTGKIGLFIAPIQQLFYRYITWGIG